PPFTLVVLRVTLAAFALWTVVWVTGCRWPRPGLGITGALIVQGVLACLIPYVLIAFGQQSVDSALTAILNSMTPLFVLLIGAAMAGEVATGIRFLGAALGLIGVVAIVGAGALTGLGRDVAGQLAVLLATLSSAVGVVYGRRLSRFAPEFTAAV